MSPMRLTLSLLAVLAVAALSGCGIRRVPGNLLEKLPYEAKIELLEAENDLALAVDRVDDTHAEMLRMREQIRRGKQRLSAAESEVGDAPDQVSREVAELAVKEGEARVDWLRARQKVNVLEEKVAERNLVCAMARFEQARLTVARKAKLEGSEKLDPADFDQQVKDCDAWVEKVRADQKEEAAEAEKVRAAWEKERAALAKKTFDARASPFVE